MLIYLHKKLTAFGVTHYPTSRLWRNWKWGTYFSFIPYLAESIVGYFLSTVRLLDVAWYPARKKEPEVDFVITIGQVRIPIEVKYRRTINEQKDTANLRAFLDKKVYNASFGPIITLTDDVVIRDERIVALPLSSFLLMR